MGAGGAANPAVTPPQVQGMEGLAQASQNGQEGAALPTNQPAATAETPIATPPANQNGGPPAAPAREQVKFSGVKEAVERVVARTTAARNKHEFKWQWNKGSANANKFKDEAVTPGRDIKVFGFVQADAPIIQTVHGLGKFFDSEAPIEVNGKPIAFIGDRTSFGEPRLVISPTQATWTWKAVTVSEDEAAWATHQGDEGNKGKLWKQVGGIVATFSMPRLVFLPSVVAQFVTETPRSAWEVHQFLNEISQADGATVEAEDVADLKKWLLTVGQEAGAEALALGMAPVVTTARVFEEWSFNHLNNYLGSKRQGESNVGTNGTQQSPY
jgi:hypothetical protein